MASKYKKLNLPAWEQETSFQMKVDEWKRKNFGENPEEANILKIATDLSFWKMSKKQLEDEISQNNIAIEALSQLLVARLQAEDMEKVSLKDGSTCYISYEVYPSIRDKGELMEWIKKHKMSDSLTLPWQTLRGLCNELSLSGKPLPKGVEAYMKVSARIRKNGDS